MVDQLFAKAAGTFWGLLGAFLEPFWGLFSKQNTFSHRLIGGVVADLAGDDLPVQKWAWNGSEYLLQINKHITKIKILPDDSSPVQFRRTAGGVARVPAHRVLVSLTKRYYTVPEHNQVSGTGTYI